MQLDDEMRKIINECDWIALATCKGKACGGSTQHLIAVWEAIILEPSTLGFYAGGMFKTAENLKHNPRIEILVTSKRHKIGYRFIGKGEMVPKADLDPAVAAKMERTNSQFYAIAHSALIVKLEKSSKLI